MNTRGIRTTAAAAIAIAVTIGSGAAACSSSTKPGANANNSTDLQHQQEALTVNAYNLCDKQVSCQYPASQMANSLEMANLRERLLRFNNPNKVGYIYLFVSGSPNPVFFSSVKGKVSSTGSSMTASVGVERHGDTGGGNVNVQLPGDDLSFGPEECGDQGVFWFDEANVIHEWCQGPWLYTDAPLRLPPAVVPLQLVDGAKPSTTGAKP